MTMTNQEKLRALANFMGWKIFRAWPNFEYEANYRWLASGANYPYLQEREGGALTLWFTPDAKGRDWNPLESVEDARMILDRWCEQQGSVVGSDSDWMECGPMPGTAGDLCDAMLREIVGSRRSMRLI